MNRHERRSANAGKPKLSRDATPDEIFRDRHGPVQGEVRDLMIRVMDALKGGFGGNYDITLFIAERAVPEGQDRSPRFNYASTASRGDMLAVLEAFVVKNRAAAPTLDKINEAPPTGRAQ